MALTPEQMVAMAIEADCMRVNMYGDVAMAVERLSRFAALVTAKEREACKTVCDTTYYQFIGPEFGAVRYGIAACSSAIDARSK